MRKTLVAAALLLAAGSAGAQQLTVPEPFDLNDKLSVDGGKRFREMKKIMIPTVIVRFAARGSLTVVNQGRFFETDGKTVKAKGKFLVAGLDKEYIQGIAKQVEADLVARLKAQGYEVITYADIKDNPDVVKMKRYGVDKDWGVRTDGGYPGGKNTYLVAFPSDEQAIDPPLQGYSWGFRHLAKELDAGIMVPEYIIDAPLLTGKKQHGISTRGASVSVFPDMVVNGWVPFATAKGGWGSIRLKNALTDVADNVGEIGEAKDDSPALANALSSTLASLSPLGADMQTKSGVWGMKVKRDAYTAGVMRGIGSINMAVEKVIIAEKGKN